MRRAAIVMVALGLLMAGCQKASEKPIQTEEEVRKATDEAVQRMMKDQGMPGGPGAAPGPGGAAPAPGAPAGK